MGRRVGRGRGTAVLRGLLCPEARRRGEGDTEARGGGRAGAGGQQCWVGMQRRKPSLLLMF